MRADIHTNATDGQRAIARALVDADADAWVRNSTLLADSGLSIGALSSALNRRAEWGWIERRMVHHPGGRYVEWRATPTGRVQLRRTLLAEQAPASTPPTARELRRWAESIGLPVTVRGPLPVGLIQRWNRDHPDRQVSLPAVSYNWGSPDYARRGGLASRHGVPS